MFNLIISIIAIALIKHSDVKIFMTLEDIHNMSKKHSDEYGYYTVVAVSVAPQARKNTFE